MASSRSLRDKWRDARGLSGREIRWLVAAWFGLPFVRWRLNRQGLRGTQLALDVAEFHPRNVPRDEVLRFARVVQAAANHHLFRLTCLPQSVWIWSRLRRRGVNCELRLGVNSVEGDMPGAHAWVEYEGLRLNEPVSPQLQAAPFVSIDAPTPSGPL